MSTSSVYYYSMDMTISKTYLTSILGRPELRPEPVEGMLTRLASAKCRVANKTCQTSPMGNSILKILPWPGALSTQTRPL
jgi:hypothetical protein